MALCKETVKKKTKMKLLCLKYKQYGNKLLNNVYLLLSSSHMELLHECGGGGGGGGRGGGGTVQLRRPISFAVQWSAITEQSFTS